MQSVASYSARAETALTHARESAAGAWRLKMHQAVRWQHVTLYCGGIYLFFLFVENKIPNNFFFSCGFTGDTAAPPLQDRETMRGASARDVSARGASLPADADARAVCAVLADLASLGSAAG